MFKNLFAILSCEKRDILDYTNCEKPKTQQHCRDVFQIPASVKTFRGNTGRESQHDIL